MGPGRLAARPAVRARLGGSPRRHLANAIVEGRAALLHTDVVLLAQMFPGIVPPPKPRSEQSLLEREEVVPLVIARGPDGRFENFERGNLNWDCARDLLDAVTPAPEADETVALWYRAVTAMFASTYSFGEALPHLERARRLLHDDPGILFGDAAIQARALSIGAVGATGVESPRADAVGPRQCALGSDTVAVGGARRS